MIPDAAVLEKLTEVQVDIGRLEEQVKSLEQRIAERDEQVKVALESAQKMVPTREDYEDLRDRVQLTEKEVAVMGGSSVGKSLSKMTIFQVLPLVLSGMGLLFTMATFAVLYLRLKQP